MLETGGKKDFESKLNTYYFQDVNKNDRFLPNINDARIRSFTVPTDLSRYDKNPNGISSLGEVSDEFLLQQTMQNSVLFLNLDKQVDLNKYITLANEQHVYVNIEINSKKKESVLELTGPGDLSKESLNTFEESVKVNRDTITRWLNDYGIASRLRSFSTNNFYISELNDLRKTDYLSNQITQTTPVYKKRSRDKLFTKLMHSKINKVVKITVPKLPGFSLKETEKAPNINRNNKPYFIKKFIPEVIKEEEMSEEGERVIKEEEISEEGEKAGLNDELVNKLVKEIDDLNNRLKDAENRKNLWNPISDFNCENVHKALDEVKIFNDSVTTLEPYIDGVNGKVKSLRVSYGFDLGQKQKQIDDFLQRWSKLQSECEQRHNMLNNILNNDQDNKSQLQGSVSPPWERSCSLNKVPYYINHTTKVTQWDHPKMTELYNTLAELNDVKFAAYRTSMKLRCIQKACCLDLVDMNNVAVKAFQRHDITANNDSLIDVGEMIAVLLTMFGTIDPARKEAIVVTQCVDLTLNWLLNVFDSGRIGKLRVLSFKIAIVLLCRAKLENKWKYLFEQIADSTGCADSKKLGLLLHDCVQIPRQLGEIAAFGGSNIEPSARSCFEKAKNPNVIEVNNFLEWTSAEPQSLVWMTVLHRLAAAETAKHDAKCGICKDFPIVGFRYRCLKCFNYDLCQNCFWSGRVSKSHRLTHPMHQYSLATTAGEDMSDFVKLMKNKFKSRRYRSRPPKKLGYLPVQTIMEGSSIETPSVPSSPIKFSYSSNDRSGSPESENYRMVDDINEEHRLIQHMCKSLSCEDSRLLPLKSPSAILASLDIEEKNDIVQSVNDIISDLEEEHRVLETEYNRLKNVRANGSNPRSSSDSELIAEAQLLRDHKNRLEARMQILEHHNKQLEAQLQRLRQLLEQPQSDRSVQSSAGVTPTLTPSSSYHGSPELGRRDYSFTNGYSLTNAMDIQQVTHQIENAFPMD